MRGLRVVIGLVALTGGAAAADMPVKAPPPAGLAAYDWSGVYLGGHIGYAAGFVPLVGDADWSGGAGAERLARSVQQLQCLQRYGQLLRGFPGRLQLHVAVALAVRHRGRRVAEFPERRHYRRIDASPRPRSGRRAMRSRSSFPARCAAASAMRQILGTTIGCSMRPAALPTAFDQFTRTQIAGTAGRRHRGAGPNVEKLFMVPRVGGVAGAGVEARACRRTGRRGSNICSSITATAASRSRPARSVLVPISRQRIALRPQLQAQRRSELGQCRHRAAGAGVRQFRRPRPDHTISVNMSSRSAIPIPARTASRPTRAAKPGTPRPILGMRLWQGAELWVNPEIDQGFGLSSTLGVAGFPSGEAYKVGAAVPYARIPRYFVRQTIDLGGDTQKVGGRGQPVQRLANGEPAGRSPSASSPSPTFSTPTNMPTIRAAIS